MRRHRRNQLVLDLDRSEKIPADDAGPGGVGASTGRSAARSFRHGKQRDNAQREACDACRRSRLITSAAVRSFMSANRPWAKWRSIPRASGGSMAWLSQPAASGSPRSRSSMTISVAPAPDWSSDLASRSWSPRSATGSIGAVFCIEASRLARNGRDWHHLVDLCALVGTLVIDPDGTYDPRLVNDRLLLGLKGTMSEYELSLLRQRGLAARDFEGSTRRTAVRLPPGFCWNEIGQIEMDPDERLGRYDPAGVRQVP